MMRATWSRAAATAILCVLLCAPRAAVAQTETGKDKAPPKTVTVKVTTRAPDPDKWRVANSTDRTRRLYTCKPLACSSPATVLFIFQKGSMTPPSPEALEKFATVDLPKSIRAATAAQAVMTNQAEHIETLFSKPITLKNYPSALNETKIARGLASVYVEIAIIFACPIIIRVELKSPSRDLAKNSLQGFIQEMQIAETEGLPPGMPVPSKPRPPKTESL